MRTFLFVFSAIIVSVYADDLCENVKPQSGVDWTKLEGSWRHLLFFNGFGPTCRNMKISNVDVKSKFVKAEFYELVRYESILRPNPKNEIYFKWYEDPGVINTRINPTSMNKKISAKFLSKRKSLSKASSDIGVSKYVVLATDYEKYMILVQCNERVLSVGVSLRLDEVDSDAHMEIRGKLISAGIDVSKMQFNGTRSCPQ